MRRIMYTFLVLGLIAGINLSFAQADVQDEYNAKIQKANEIRAEMSEAGITKERYEELNAQYQAITKELEQLKSKLSADAEYQDKMNNAKKAFNDGNTAFKKGQYEVALESYNKAISLNESYPHALYGKGLALVRLRRYDDAIQAYRAAVEIDPGYAAAWSAMGAAYSRAGNIDAAIEAYVKAVETDPNSSRTLYNLGTAYLRIKENQKAINAFTRATQVDPEYAKAYNSLGIAHKNAGNYDQAIMAFSNAVSIESDLDEAWARLASAYNEMGQTGEALNAAEKVTSKSKRSNHKPLAYLEKGIALQKMDRDQEAIQAFEQAGRDRRYSKLANWHIEEIKAGR